MLGVGMFTLNFGSTSRLGCWEPLKDAIRTRLTALGRPLHEAFEREGQQAALGLLQDELQLHPLAQGGKKLRLDLPGIMPVPKQWKLDGLGRSPSECAYYHMIRLVSMAIIEQSPPPSSCLCVILLPCITLFVLVYESKGRCSMLAADMRDHHEGQ